MNPSGTGLNDTTLVRRADVYRAEAEGLRRRDQESQAAEEQRKAQEQAQLDAQRNARAFQEQATTIWTRAYADDYLEAQRQRRERLAKEEDLERELKRMRFERTYGHPGVAQGMLGAPADPWWKPIVEVVKAVGPVLVATAPIWVPILIRRALRFRKKVSKNGPCKKVGKNGPRKKVGEWLRLRLKPHTRCVRVHRGHGLLGTRKLLRRRRTGEAPPSRPKALFRVR